MGSISFFLWGTRCCSSFMPFSAAFMPDDMLSFFWPLARRSIPSRQLLTAAWWAAWLPPPRPLVTTYTR